MIGVLIQPLYGL